MMSSRISRVLLYLCISFGLILTSCRPSAATPQPPPSITLKEAAYTQTAKPTLSPSPTSSITPTPLFIEEFRPPSFTLQPLPTFSESSYEQFILGMLHSNGGCKLPCWWLAAPDDMPGDFFLQILSSTNREVQIAGEEAEVEFFISEKAFHLIIEFSPLNVSIKKILVRSYILDDGRFLFGQPSYETFMGHYGLSNLLYEYDKPTEIMVLTEPPGSQEFFQGKWDYEILLYNTDWNFVARYWGLREDNPGKVHLCPSASMVELWLFSDWIEGTFAEVFQEFSADTSLWRYYLPLESATGMSVDEFYDTFTANPSACLETQAQLWNR